MGINAKSPPQGPLWGLDSQFPVTHTARFAPPPSKAQWDCKLALKFGFLSSAHLSIRAFRMCGTDIASGIRFAEVILACF